MPDQLPKIVGPMGPLDAVPVLVLNEDGTPTDQAALIAAIGSPSDAAWNGTDPNATVISLLKAIAINTDTV